MGDNHHPLNTEELDQDILEANLETLTTSVNANTTAISNIDITTINNKLSGGVSSGLKTLIEGNDTDIANIKTKTDFISITQNCDLDQMETDIGVNNLKNGITSAEQSKLSNISVSSSVNLNTMNNSITANTNAIDSIELKTDNISITQNVNLDTIESDVNGLKNLIEVNSSHTRIKTTTNNKIEFYEGSTELFDSNEVKNLVDNISITQNVNLDQLESDVGNNNNTTTNFGNLINNSLSCALKSSLDSNTSNINGILNNSLSSTLKSAVDANSAKTGITTSQANAITANTAKIGFPSTLNSLLSVSDTYELEVGSGSGIPRIRLNGANGVNTSSEIIFIDATGNNPEYYQGFTLRYNSADNIFQIGADNNNNNNPLECLRIDRSSRESQFKKVCVYLDEIEAKGASGVSPANANLMLTTKQGSLPGYSSDYYPTIKTSGAYMYFAVGGNYVGYLTSSSVGQIDFTGQHRCVPVNNNLINDLSNNIGKIVISSGEICSLIEDASHVFHPTTGKNGITINESIPKVLLSNQYKDKRIFGVISDGTDTENNNEKHYKIGAFTSVIHLDNSDNRLTINGTGEGGILVSDICGNIENGDLITTSILEGIGCKQDDDLIHNYTIAKATINCDFDLNSNNYHCYLENGNKIAFISCIYLL